MRCREEDGFSLPAPSQAEDELPPVWRGLGGGRDWDHGEGDLAGGSSPTQQKAGCSSSEWGSAAAEQAAARLTALGASVTPPGKKGAIDWDALAGEGP